MAEILAGKEGEERLLFKSVGGRPPRRIERKKRKAEKREFQTLQKNYPGMFGFSRTNHASVSREEEWNLGCKTFRVHTQRKGRNVHVKQDLPPLKHGQRGCGPGVVPPNHSWVNPRSLYRDRSLLRGPSTTGVTAIEASQGPYETLT